MCVTKLYVREMSVANLSVTKLCVTKLHVREMCRIVCVCDKVVFYKVVCDKVTRERVVYV